MKLTEREKGILFYLTKGLENLEISKVLGISVHTTKAHLESIYKKLEVDNRVQAAIKAIYYGLVEIEEVVK